MSKDKYYAVAKGKKTGIYSSWEECQEQIRGFSNAKYKKFDNYKEAESFVLQDNRIVGSKIIPYKKNSNKENVSISNNKNKKGILETKKDIESLSDSEAIIYVDGSYNKNNKSYSYGIVLLTNKSKETKSGKGNDPELASMRNVAGELAGAMVAMKLAVDKGLRSIYLHYDYEGIEKWALGKWKRNKEGTKRYKEYYDSIKDVLDVIFIKVPAHTGIMYNEEADKLAKEAFL